MKELVGECCSCGKEIYCFDGFFNGIHTIDNKILCFACSDDSRQTADD